MSNMASDSQYPNRSMKLAFADSNYKQKWFHYSVSVLLFAWWLYQQGILLLSSAHAKKNITMNRGRGAFKRLFQGKRLYQFPQKYIKSNEQAELTLKGVSGSYKKGYVFPCHVSFACSTIKINPTGPNNWVQPRVCEWERESWIDLYTETSIIIE